MTLEELIRGRAQGHWTLEVYGIGAGYLKIRIAPAGDRDEAVEYWLVGNCLLEEPPERPLPPEESPYILLDTESIGVEAVAA